MADAKLTALTAASALAGADLFYVSQSAASRKATGTQLLTLVGTTYVPLAGGTMTGALRISTLYTDASNYERLTLTGVAGTSVNITAETLGTGGDNIDLVLTSAGTGSYKFGTVASFSSTGYLLAPGALLSTIFSVNYFSSTIRIGGSADLGWSSTASVASVPDVALRRSAAGVLDLDSGTSTQYRDLKLRNLLQTEYSQLTEMTAPAAPAANSVRIYAEDNGAGKTRLMALFASGAAVQLGIEP